MDTQPPKIIKWTPATAEYFKNPYANLNACLAFNPVQQVSASEWVLFRYEHIKQLLRDQTCLTADLSGFFEKKEPVLLKNTSQCPFLSKATRKWIMYLDGDAHSVARELVEKVLKCYDLDEIVNSCLNDWISRFFEEDRLDMAHVASVLPSLIFLSLYQPLNGDWASFEHLKQVSQSLARSQDLYKSVKQYHDYNADAAWLFSTIRKDFDDINFADSALVRNFLRVNEEMGNLFTVDELVSLAIILFFASVETTVDTISTSVYEFFKNPELLDYILSADAKQINILAEELFRFASPQQYTIRINTKPIEIGGHLIPENSRIYLCIASANYDQAVFENPDQIVANRSYNPHLAFGSGTHACLGARLARIELRALLKPLAGVLKNYKLDESTEVEWQKAIFMRGVKNLWSVKI